MENPLSLLRFTNRPSLPMLLQSEVAECGLACMAMVASYHGHQLDLNSVRRYYPISLRGTNLQHLSELADRLGFSCRALRLELGEMGQLQLPAILHWDLNHFVVLKKVTDTGVIVHDPAHGVRTYTFAEASKHFSGVALELQPSTKFEKKDEREKLPLGPIIKK
ncbi:MAG: cysteine peptidase family C39 domain-containing protein, partial [Pseudomonadota bacterium]